jgi:predicted outer membrane protein
MHSKLLAASAALLVVAAAPVANAQMPTWSAEQADAWKVIQQSWVDDVAQNGKWPGEYADPQMVVWSSEYAAPRGKDSAVRWTKFQNSQGKVIQYELSPQSISLSGNTAVVTYALTVVSQRGTEKPDWGKEAIVETLVRSGTGWKFLSSTSFALGK